MSIIAVFFNFPALREPFANWSVGLKKNQRSGNKLSYCILPKILGCVSVNAGNQPSPLVLGITFGEQSVHPRTCSLTRKDEQNRTSCLSLPSVIFLVRHLCLFIYSLMGFMSCLASPQGAPKAPLVKRIQIIKPSNITNILDKTNPN